MLHPFRLVLAAAVVLGASLASAQETPEILPKRKGASFDWAGLMEQTKTKPLVVPKESRSPADVGKSCDAWALRKIVTPERERLHGAPDEKELSEFLDRAVALWTFADSRPLTPAFLKQAQAIINGPTRRPALDFMAARVCSEGSDEKNCLKADQLVAGAPADAVFPSLFRLMAQAELLKEADAHRPGQVKEATARFMDILTAHLAEETDDEDARWITFFHATSAIEKVRDKREPAFINHYKKSKLPEWARLTMAGDAEWALSWRYGGHGCGYPEKPAEEVEKHRQLAIKMLTRAWELMPTVPYAAETMIQVTGIGDNQADTIRLWFDRAFTAEFDYTPTFRSYINAMRPYWGGSFDRMLAFGRSCAETKRDDSDLPTRFNETVHEIAYDLDDWRVLYRNPDLARLLLETREKRVATAEAGRRGQTRQAAQLCAEAWAAGDLDRAVKAMEFIKMPDGRYNYQADQGQVTYDLAIDWRLMFTEILLHGSDAREDFAQAVAAREKRDFAEAEKRFQAALAKAPEKAKGRLGGEIALTKFQAQYDQGDWTPIPMEDAGCWQQYDGLNLWDAKTKRLKLTGEWIFGKSLFRGKLGAHFEVRGHFKTQPRGPHSAGLGIYCGHSPMFTGRGTSFWWSLRIDPGNETTNDIHFAPKYDAEDDKDRKHVKWSDDSPFLYRRDGGKVSFSVGDREIIHERHFDEDAPSGEAAWGLGVLGQGKGAASFVWELEARRLDRPL